MPRGRKRGGDERDSASYHPRSRGHCTVELSLPEFVRSVTGLRGLGATDDLRLAGALASARGFFDQWRTRDAARDHELRTGRWQYKPLHGKQARAAGLRQICLDGLHRATLIVEERTEVCVMTFLLAYHKREQDAAIERAAAIARRITKGWP